MIRLPLYGRNPSAPPIVTDVLDFPSLRRGDPVVVGGAEGLGRRVRWVHVSEAPGIADLLHGNEMLLTTGVMLHDDPASLAGYVERLDHAGIAALVIGLGPRFSEPLPQALIDAADRTGLPLIALRRTIAFIDVTEEVHASLIDVQVRELQASESIHIIFSALAVQGSRPEVVLKQVAKLSGFAVVLENKQQQILGFDPAERSRGDVLAEWREHTQRPARTARTYYDPQRGWLQTTVGARGNDWGRLILMAGTAGPRELGATADPTMTVPHSLIMLIEQAASTLAIGRLVERESELLALTTHQGILNRLLNDTSDPIELEQQASALGVSFRRAPLITLAARAKEGVPEDPDARRQTVSGLATAIAEITRNHRVAALIAPVDDSTVGVVAAWPSLRSAPEVGALLSAGLADRGHDVLIAVGAPGRGWEQARAGLIEAIDVVAAAVGLKLNGPVLTPADLGLRGLIYSLRDNAGVQQFAHRTLAPLAAYDLEHGTALTSLLRHYVQAGRNKTTAAQRAFVSRPWMHERLKLVERVLDVDLEDEGVCVTLQVALLVCEQLPDLLPLADRKAGS